MSATLKIEGLDEFIRRNQSAKNAFPGALRTALRRSVLTVQKRMRSKAAVLGRAPHDRRLPNAIRYEIAGRGLEGIVAPLAKTALSIEQGRRPGERVPVRLLAAWVHREGIAEGARVSVKTRRALRAGAGQRRAERDLAWKTRMSIQQGGTPPLPFVIPTAKESPPEVKRYFTEAVNQLVKKMAH